MPAPAPMITFGNAPDGQVVIQFSSATVDPGPPMAIGPMVSTFEHVGGTPYLGDPALVAWP